MRLSVLSGKWKFTAAVPPNTFHSLGPFRSIPFPLARMLSFTTLRNASEECP